MLCSKHNKLPGSPGWILVECDFGFSLGLYEEGVGAVYVSPEMEFSQQ